jgi:hypothetical protein
MRAKTGGAIRSWLLIVLACTAAGAIAQPAAIDSTALKARINQLPATTIDLNKAAEARVVRPAPTPIEAAKAAKAPASVTAAPRPRTSGFARYVPLPPEEAQATRKILTQQLAHLKPTRPDLPAFVAFKGAVMIQTNDAAEVALIPLALVDDPLRFDAASKQFVGRIAVGLVELGYKGPAKALSAPIGFQVFGDARTDPDIAQVGSTSPPFQIIRISASDPRDSVELQVVSNVSAEPVKLTLPVQRARLELRAKTRLQGWGLESTDVVVSASDGEGSKGQVVVLDAPRGTITPEKVVLAADGTATASLRSESTGRVQLTATSARLESARLGLDYEFPARVLIAGVFGGLAGGLLRRGLKRGGSSKRIALELLLGVLAGAVVFGLFALGVNVVGFQLPQNGGEVLVAVVSALGAYFGTRLLEPKPTA